MKFFKKVKYVLDCSLLNLDAIFIWCQLLLNLNIDKCQVTSFHRNKHPIHFNYTIDDQVLDRVNEIRDLGVIMDSNINFNRHIEFVIANAYLMLGFIINESALSFGTSEL